MSIVRFKYGIWVTYSAPKEFPEMNCCLCKRQLGWVNQVFKVWMCPECIEKEGWGWGQPRDEIA